MNKTTSKVLDRMIDDAAADLAALRVENARLREALQSIIDENPDPKLPYGQRILAIARTALAAAPNRD